MLHISTPHTVRSFFESRIVLAVLVGLAVFFVVGIGREIFRRYSLDQQFSDLEQTITKLESQNTELTGLIGYFQSDTYQEEQARLKLGFSERGESAVTVPVPDTPEITAQKEAASEANGRQQDPLNTWIDYFFAHITS